ncbi:MAG: DNA polymerase domain-containing protein [Conexivisphaerales archaeon]
MQEYGWLLDVYIHDNTAVLWIKREDGSLIRITDSYAPSFYVKPIDWVDRYQILQSLQDYEHTKAVAEEDRIVSIAENTKVKLIRIETRSVYGFNILVKRLSKDHEVYNADLEHVQLYLFQRLRIEPTSKVAFEHYNGRLLWMKKLDDENIVEPPPFSMMRMNMLYSMHKGKRELHEIEVYDKSSVFTVKKEDLIDYISMQNPDIIVLPKCDEVALQLIIDNKLSISRVDEQEQVKRQGSWGGRILIGDSIIGHSAEQWGIAGLVERARFGFLPVGIATRWLSNKTIDSRNCYELMKRGYAIPREEYFESARQLCELAERDRGGINVTPEAGILHQNVASLDFDSQYPNIMLKKRLSYEDPLGNYDSLGLIAIAIEPWLRRRLMLKRIRKELKKGSKEREYCEQRIDALKLILVTSYGISGCCWNRFGNVLTFEEINRYSREAILKAKYIAQQRGYEIVYCAVDSLFVKKNGANREDYESLAQEISEKTGLPMSLDKHFKFLAFGKLKSNGVSSALSRYFGITFDGEIEARGIELRRNDVPEFIKRFQAEFILQLLDHDSIEEVIDKGLVSAKKVLRDYLSMIRDGKVDTMQLMLRRDLRKELDKYKVRTSHSMAAIQLMKEGKDVAVGDTINFFFTDHDNKNPACRVRTVPEVMYDSVFYSKILMTAANSILEATGLKVESTKDYKLGLC